MALPIVLSRWARMSLVRWEMLWVPPSNLWVALASESFTEIRFDLENWKPWDLYILCIHEFYHEDHQINSAIFSYNHQPFWLVTFVSLPRLKKPGSARYPTICKWLATSVGWWTESSKKAKWLFHMMDAKWWFPSISYEKRFGNHHPLDSHIPFSRIFGKTGEPLGGSTSIEFMGEVSMRWAQVWWIPSAPGLVTSRRPSMPSSWQLGHKNFPWLNGSNGMIFWRVQQQAGISKYIYIYFWNHPFLGGQHFWTLCARF